MLWNVSCSQLGHVVRVFSKRDQSKSSTVSHFVLYSVFCGCDRSRHLSHPAADRPHHCCDSGLLQAQEESRERKPPTAECGPLNAHTSLLKNAVWLNWTLSCKDSRRANQVQHSSVKHLNEPFLQFLWNYLWMCETQDFFLCHFMLQKIETQGRHYFKTPTVHTSHAETVIFHSLNLCGCILYCVFILFNSVLWIDVFFLGEDKNCDGVHIFYYIFLCDA